MARPSATALLLLVLSLLAVAHCRTLEADDATSELESNSAVAVSDENRLPTSNPTLPAEAGDGASASAATQEQEEALPVPVELQHGFDDFLRLPSHRLRGHRGPCSGSLHRHLGLRARHLHHGERPEEMMRHHGLPILPAAAEVEEEAKAVAEPDPDPDRSLSLPDTDGEAEPSAAVRAWKKEMLRRWVHLHLHHGMRGGHRLHHHVHHDEQEEEKILVGKRWLRRHAAERDEDSVDGEEDDEQVEEMVRRFRKAIMMRRRFGHGHGRGFFHHHHHHSHRHAEEQADGEEESGVMAWIKGLMNRF